MRYRAVVVEFLRVEHEVEVEADSLSEARRAAEEPDNWTRLASVTEDLLNAEVQEVAVLELEAVYTSEEGP